MMGNPSTRRTERITKHSDESNWRSRKWEKPIQEVESPSPAPKTEMSIKLENDDEQNQRSRLKEIIKQRIESQLIAQPTKKTIEEIAQDDEDERNLRNRLKKGIILRTEPLSIAHTPFIEEMETDEESETEEDYKRRREFIHAYLTMDNEDEQVNHKETETDEGIIGTPEEQKERLIHAYLTSTMEKEENEREEQNNRRELLHVYSKRTMDNDEKQKEQDETDTYLRTSTEEKQKSSTWEEYDEEEPLEEYEENEPFEESDDEGKGMTQLSYPTEEEENALFIAFMTGSVEDQKTWINAKMNLTKATTDDKTRRREKEILDRIIPTETMDLDEPFEEGDEEETDDLSKYRTYDQENKSSPMRRGIYSPLFTEEEELDGSINENTEEGDIQPLEPLTVSYLNRQDKETVNPLTLITEPDDQFKGARCFAELDMRWKYDDEHIKDEDQWKEDLETTQVLSEPTVIISRLYYSPPTSQHKTDELFPDRKQKNELRIIDNRDYDIQIKEEDSEDTRSVPRRSRDNDLSTEADGCTSWITRTEYEGLLDSENQMKLYGIDIC